MSKKLWRIGKEELENIKKTINNGFSGIAIHQFEESFAKAFGVKYAIALNSGTSALHTAVAALGIGPGDEVIVPPLTFAATAFCVLYAGAVPVFADVDFQTFNINPDEIEKKITSRTKAIISVSLYGLPPDMDRIMKIARRHNLKVIEDNAQCVLGKYKGKIAGTIGNVSIFSLQRSKHLTTGDGGVITTNDQFVAEKMRKISDLGYATLKAKHDPSISFKEMIQQPEFKRHVLVGYNFRMPEVCAAIGLAQIKKINMFVKKRKAIGKMYQEVLDKHKIDWLQSQRTPKGIEHSYWTFVMRFDPLKIDSTWNDFRLTFLSYGGEAFYGAWSLTYLEPALEGMVFPENNLSYRKGLCPVAESLQPNLIQLKTNFQDLNYAKKQAEVLNKTIKELKSKFNRFK